MSSHRSRGHSPPRHYADQPRSTTGAFYVTSFDTASRGGSQPPRTSVSSVSSGGRHSVQYQAQPVGKSTTADGNTTTRYAIRPSHHASDAKRPPSISTREYSPPRRNSLALTSPRQTTPTVVRGDSNRLLQPALTPGHQQGFHQRHNSTSVADSRPRDIGGDRREKSYHQRSPCVERAYHDSRVPARASDDEGWSYTGPREQFDRDYPQRPPAQRQNPSRKERPAKDYEIDRPTIKRDYAPPQSSNRKAYRDELDPRDTRSGFDSDPDRRSEVPKRRHSTRQPVLHQQPARDDGYSSAKDEYDSRVPPKHKHGRYNEDEGLRQKEHQRDPPRGSEYDRNYDRQYHKDPERERPRDYEREREHDRTRDRDYDERSKENRRNPRSREDSPERSNLKSLATGALSSLAAAGVGKGFNRDHKEKDRDKESPREPEPSGDDDSREKRHRKHRRRSRQEDQYEESDRISDRRRDDHTRSRHRDGSSDDNADDRSVRESRSQRKARDDEEVDDGRQNGQLLLADAHGDWGSSKVRQREPEEQYSDTDRQSRALVPVHKQDRDLDALETRTISPGENEDDRPRRVQLVEPVREREDVRPRGILKPARQTPFPEDPNPIREGVAPLKDATKDGIPPNARWTKINRLLVNPEALEKYHERFEERDDYVIVLRVLSREEIKKLADKTKEIRDAREKEWQQQLSERRDRSDRRPGNSNDAAGSDQDIDYDNKDDRPRSQLTIEGPSAPPVDSQNLPNAQSQHASARSVAGGPPIPDINLDANYSQNV